MTPIEHRDALRELLEIATRSHLHARAADEHARVLDPQLHELALDVVRATERLREVLRGQLAKETP